MKNRIMKVVATVAMMSVMTMGLVGCGGSDNASTNEDSAKKTEDTSSVESEAKDDNTSLSGKISLAGSTSMEKVCEGLSESFMEAYPGITVTVEYTGSGAGLESLAAGSVDIGNSSRKLSDEEKAAGSVENVIALDGIAVITDSENKVKDISSEDLAKVYKGEITNWSELGGDDEAIVVVGRESGSGTRGAFEELLDIEDACNYAQELDSTGAVLANVSLPTYDITRYFKDYSKLAADTESPLWNRGVQSAYAPGSTMKPAISIAALEEEAADINTTCYCGGSYTLEDQTFK